ncbi:MAG: GlsB/YeaQ/YmgE family stress response membrane protein [Ardenticatenales bacterium]|nr:GlsB/YeaQ/YmgE family stress response membrane protein [Ardenticatenales bacterium]
MNIIWWIIIGGIAGWMASKVMDTGDRQGCLFDIILGILGGMLGGWLLTNLGLGMQQDFWGSLFTAFLGAVLLLFIRKQFFGRRR